MPAVFVHGVPETPAVWGPLLDELGREDVITLHLPGFMTPRPDGFTSTKEEYVDWVIGELERIGADGPIDLVGHDWGGGFVVRVVSLRADLVQSWASDAAGLGDVNFEWHDFAKIWQTPGAGEEFFEQQLAAGTEGRAAIFEAFGVPAERAALIAQVDETMADSILRLYRSAVDVGKEWAPDFENVPKPGLILVPSDDPFLSADLARTGATRAGAGVAEMSGVGHWWMLQDPALGARTLREFWGSL
jgi:pimeloyl-ACP methyl ester carboxylesterase